MSRVYNFSPGPAALPEAVLTKAAAEMVEHPGSRMSVMEMSHRSKMFTDIIEGAESLFRELMGIPSNYKVLFLQGGASQQFALIPMNLAKNGKADYVLSGIWSKKAAGEAKKLLTVNIAATSEDAKFKHIPEIPEGALSPDADYVHITSNNTICGTKFTKLPDTKGIPLVSDMSSSILSEVIDVSKFGLIYAGAQKNIGPAGVTIVIIREDLLETEAAEKLPGIFQYKNHAAEKSLLNTPPTYSIYMAKLCLEWLKEQGGVAGIQKVNEQKAALMYDYFDSSALFSGIAAKADRSLMNIPFTSGSDDTDKAFVKAAAEEGLVNLSGHRLVGGLRASIYNAMPLAGVEKLVGFMREFEAGR